MNKSINTVLFDLDGTLFDTAPDIIDALNRVLRNHGREEVELATLRSRINGGSLALLGHTFNIDEHHPDFEPLKEQLLSHYADISDYKTNFFEGIPEVLNYLDEHNIPWGIVTNRITKLAAPLIKHFGLENRSRCLVGMDLVKNPKPHPDPLLHACELMKIKAEETVYIGDSHTDIQAARAAKMPVILAAYGYIPTHENTEAWEADHSIKSPLDIISWMEKSRA